MEPVATSIQNDMAIILSILITYPYAQILYMLHQSHILGTREKKEGLPHLTHWFISLK